MRTVSIYSYFLDGTISVLGWAAFSILFLDCAGDDAIFKWQQRWVFLLLTLAMSLSLFLVAAARAHCREDEAEDETCWLFATGFLPPNNIPRLPVYFERWENIMDKLASLNKNRKIREVVEKLPLLDAERLKSGGEFRRAYVVLAMLVQSYTKNRTVPWELLNDNVSKEERSKAIYMANKASPQRQLPSQLALPFSVVCSKIGVPCVITAAALDLWNIEIVDRSKPPAMDNLELISSMTGTPTERYFHAVPAAMHALFGSRVLRKLLRGPGAIRRRDLDELEDLCSEIRDVLVQFRSIISEGTRKMNKQTFYSVYRPLLAGFASGCPLELSGVGTSVVASGPSAGQSSMIAMLDAFLGIVHPAVAGSFQREMLKYQPRPHRTLVLDFEDELRDCGSILDLLRGCSSLDPDLSRLRVLHRACIDAYVSFRTRHLGIATKFLSATTKGTGESTFRNMLKAAIDGTQGARVLDEAPPPLHWAAGPGGSEGSARN